MVYDQPAQRRAALAAGAGGGKHDGPQRQFQIGRCGHDRAVVAPQFEQRAPLDAGDLPEQHIIQHQLFECAAGIAGECAAAADDAMAGHDHRQRILCDGRADRSHRARRPDLLGDVAIAARLPGADAQQRAPHRALEFGAVQIERHVETRAAAGEISSELLGRSAQQRIVGPLGSGECARMVLLSFEPHASQALCGAREQHRAERRRECCLCRAGLMNRLGCMAHGVFSRLFQSRSTA